MRKRIISIVMVFLMLTSSLPLVSANSSADDEAPAVHWGEEAMQKWISKGMLGGYPDGSIQPDRQVTRAEFAKLVNAVFGLSSSAVSPFVDVATDAWYSNDIAAIKEAGIITGYPDGDFKPDAPITRQEAAKIIAPLFQLQAGDGHKLAAFTDHLTVQSYAKEPLEQLLAGGYIQGYPDQTIRPQKPITRAEAIALLDRLAVEVVNTAGSYDNLSTVGNAVINKADVNLNKAVITGDLFLTEGIGEGDVFLTNVEVKGTVYIHGGGINSIHLNHSKLNKVIVNKKNGIVRVVFGGKTDSQQIDVNSGAIVEIGAEASTPSLNVEDTANDSIINVKGAIKLLKNRGTNTILNGNPFDKGKEASILNGVINGQSSAPGQGGGGSTTPAPEATPNPTTAPTTEPEPPKDEWKLVWNDEFDGSGENIDFNGVNLDKWSYQLGTGSQYGLDGWGNNEEQYYRAENISVKDGKLTITAEDENFEGKAYTSGRLYTQPTFNKAYGKFEASIKLPVGEGIWPAFWMMPTESEYGVWAASGEIDIMEARGRLPKEVGGTIHYGRNWPSNKLTGSEYNFGESSDITEFHTYGLEWEPGELRWYVDGQLYQKLNNWDSWGADQPAKYAFPAPFDKPFYMILNMAIGGNYDGGRTPDSSEGPWNMEVDYVRVYDLISRPYKTPVEPAFESEPYPDPYKAPIAGNFVHDMSYNEPFTTITEPNQALDPKFWNFAHISTFQGNGTISVDAIDGVKYAKADITSGGNAAHAVQLIQNVTLGKGRWYKLTFDAQSSANRNMTVKFGGGENRGWTTYSDNLEARLTNSLQSYEMIFQMAVETDTLARLEFNVGLSTNPIWIGNVKVQETNAPDPFHDHDPKKPLNGNHVYNGTFDLGRMDRMTYWDLTSDDDKAVGSVDSAMRELKVSIGSGVIEPSSVKLTQSGINLVEGNDYKITFKARAASDRTIQLGVNQLNGVQYADLTTVAITTEMKEYTLLFTMEQPTDILGQLVFMLGGQQADVYLDDITMVRLTNNNSGELELSKQFPVKNGDFSDGKVGWSEHVQGRYDGWGSSADFTVQDGELKLAIASEGTNPWDVMLMQTDFDLFKGHTYIVSLDISSSKNREMELVIDTSDRRYLSEKVALTSTKQTFNYELTVQADMTASLKLLLGKLDGAAVIGAHDVFVDNIHVELKDARVKAFPLQNGYFDAGMQAWSTHVQGIYDGTSSAVISADHGAVRATIANTGAKPWDIILLQGELALDKGKTYIVSFTARASKPRTIEAIVENSSYIRYLNQTVLLDDVTNSYSYEFTMDKDELVGFKLLLGNQSDAPADTHEVFIDNVRVELKGAKEAVGEKARSSNQIPLT